MLITNFAAVQSTSARIVCYCSRSYLGRNKPNRSVPGVLQLSHRKYTSQTTVLVGGSNGTKTLVALLGDKSNPHNNGHTIRVVTRSPQSFSNSKGPMEWKCNEQLMKIPDEVPLTVFPSSIFTSWTSHVGAADSVLQYNDDDPIEEEDAFDKAISGIGTTDGGGVADCVILCCPLDAHSHIFKRIARAMYRLDRKGLLIKSSTSSNEDNEPPEPIMIGSLYGAGGLDWHARVAFHSERPKDFSGKWRRDLCFFGLKAFPFLTKSIKPGLVTLYGRFPELLVALSPQSPRNEKRARVLLNRLLQKGVTKRGIKVLGSSSGTGREQRRHDGSDGVRNNAINGALSKDSFEDNPQSTLLDRRLQETKCNEFLACTMNATNQWLHPCIMVALFNDANNPLSKIDGRIKWPLSEMKTEFPRFYTDGASKPEAGKLITAMACAEVYPLLEILDAVFSQQGSQSISQWHGGEPVGRMVMDALGNSPQNIGERSGLTKFALEQHIPHEGLNNSNMHDSRSIKHSSSRDRVRMFDLLAFIMGFGLSHNHRIGHVLSPAERIQDEEGTFTDYIRPIPTSRFFVDDLNHGLCICLGMGELFGFDLERDMPETLAVVRKLQRWMDKELVLPEGDNAGKKLVADARDLHETSAPQAFGVTSIEEFRIFLSTSPIGEDLQ